jgi:hypothetical protein
LKLNNNIRTGRVLLFLTPRKHDMCVGKWTHCHLSFQSSRHCALWICSWRSDS